MAIKEVLVVFFLAAYSPFVFGSKALHVFCRNLLVAGNSTTFHDRMSLSQLHQLLFRSSELLHKIDPKEFPNALQHKASASILDELEIKVGNSYEKFQKKLRLKMQILKNRIRVLKEGQLIHENTLARSEVVFGGKSPIVAKDKLLLLEELGVLKWAGSQRLKEVNYEWSYLIQSPWDLARKYVVLRITLGPGRVFYRMAYLSRSQHVFRIIPCLNLDTRYFPYFGRGKKEPQMNLPLELQANLFQIPQIHLMDLVSFKELLRILIRENENMDEFVAHRNANLELYEAKVFNLFSKPPERIEDYQVKHESAPDYSKAYINFGIGSRPDIKNIQFYGYPSRDKRLFYVIQTRTDADGKVFAKFQSINVAADSINSFGVNATFVEAYDFYREDLNHPELMRWYQETGTPLP